MENWNLSHNVTEHRHNTQNKHKNTERPDNNVIHTFIGVFLDSHRAELLL